MGWDCPHWASQEGWICALWFRGRSSVAPNTLGIYFLLLTLIMSSLDKDYTVFIFEFLKPGRAFSNNYCGQDFHAEKQNTIFFL